MNSLAFLGPWWQPSSQALLLGLNLGPEQVRRLTWASTDLADCAAHCVVVLELEEGIDAGRLLPAGESIDLGANLVARRPQGGPWPHPLLAVDAHTIVTGSEEALRQLVARSGDAELTNATDGAIAQEALAGRRPGRDGRSFAGRGPRPGKLPAEPGWMSGRPASRGGTCFARRRWPWDFRSNRPTSGDATWGWSARVRRWPKRSARKSRSWCPTRSRRCPHTSPR